MKNLLSKIALLFAVCTCLSCVQKSKVAYLKIPPSMTFYEGGGDLDSTVRNSRYTAITFLKDGCGVCVSNLLLWDEIVEANPLIKPVIIADVSSKKYFSALFSTWGVNYPYIFDNERKIQNLNDSIRIYEVVVVDSTYKIVAKRFPFEKKRFKKFYLNLK